MLIGGLALSVITPFLIFTIFASLGIVNYANQSEEFVKTIAPVLASTPDLADVTENMPPGVITFYWINHTQYWKPP